MRRVFGIMRCQWAKRVGGSAVVVLLAAGCTSSGGSTGHREAPGGSAPASLAALSGSINVDAASSLTEAFGTIGTRFEKAHPGVTVKVKFGASSDLATQITQGDAVDVFASASPKNMATVVSASYARDPVNFASNTAEVAVPPNNPGRVTSVQDLAKSGVKVAVCAPEVPCGALAEQVFANAKIAVKPVASEDNVKATLAVVEAGEVDAGVVYVTDVRAADDKVKGIPIPAEINVSTEYPIAALTKSKNQAVAKAFVDYVRSEDGTQVLLDAGFSKP